MAQAIGTLTIEFDGTGTSDDPFTGTGAGAGAEAGAEAGATAMPSVMMALLLSPNLAPALQQLNPVNLPASTLASAHKQYHPQEPPGAMLFFLGLQPRWLKLSARRGLGVHSSPTVPPQKHLPELELGMNTSVVSATHSGIESEELVA